MRTSKKVESEIERRSMHHHRALCKNAGEQGRVSGEDEARTDDQRSEPCAMRTSKAEQEGRASEAKSEAKRGQASSEASHNLRCGQATRPSQRRSASRGQMSSAASPVRCGRARPSRRRNDVRRAVQQASCNADEQGRVIQRRSEAERGMQRALLCDAGE